MKRLDERCSSESKRKRIPDSRGSKGKRATGLRGLEERNDTKMLIRGTERPRGRVVCEKVEKIGRLKIMESVESN